MVIRVGFREGVKRREVGVGIDADYVSRASSFGGGAKFRLGDAPVDDSAHGNLLFDAAACFANSMLIKMP